MEYRLHVMKIRYQFELRNSVGEVPVQFLKYELKFATSENPSSKAISFTDESVK